MNRNYIAVSDRGDSQGGEIETIPDLHILEHDKPCRARKQYRYKKNDYPYGISNFLHAALRKEQDNALKNSIA